MFKKTTIAAVLVVLALAATATASAGNGGTSNKSSSSMTLVVVGSSTAAAASINPSWGQVVTFDVSTAAAYPYVTLNCYQGGSWVYTLTAGAWPEAPGSHYFTLSSSAWTGGSANCTADLHTSSGGKKVALATLDFAVNA